MRPFVFIAILIALAGAALPAGAQTYDVKDTHFRPVATGSAIVVDKLVLNGPAGRDLTDVCVAFHNTDPRPVKVVEFAFAYYDDLGNHGGGETFARSGNFATGVRDEISLPVRYVRQPNCLVMHAPRRGITTIAYYVAHVDFADGTAWTAPAVTVPDRVTGNFVVAPAATP
jgi:hypothetical protein